MSWKLRIQCCAVTWQFFVTRIFVLNSCCWILSANVKPLSDIFSIWGPGLLHVCRAFRLLISHTIWHLPHQAVIPREVLSLQRERELFSLFLLLEKKVGFVLWNLRWPRSYPTSAPLAVLLHSPVTSFYSSSVVLIAVGTDVTANVVYRSLIYDHPETSANGYITSHLYLQLCFEVPPHRNPHSIYFWFWLN